MAGASLQRLMKQGSAAIILRFSAAAMGYLLLVVLARWMDAKEFGRFGFAFSLATTLAVLFDLGQRRLILRSIAAYRGRGREDLVRAVMKFGLTITSIAALLCLLALSAATFLFRLDAVFYPTAFLTAALIGSDYQTHTIRGMGKLVFSFMPREVLWRPLSLGVLALAGGGLSIVTDAATALWTMTAVLFAISILQNLFVTRPIWRKCLARIRSGEFNDPAPDETVEEARRGWRGSSLRLWLISAMNEGMTPLSVVIVGLFVSDVDTGAFFAAVRMSAIIAFPLQALNLMAAPMLAKAYAQKDHAHLQQVAGFTAAASGFTALVGAGIMAFYGRELLILMDPALAAGTNVLHIVMAGFVVAALCGSSGQLMSMTGHDRQFLWILSVCNGLGLAALVAATSVWGGIGAAWALLFGRSSWNVVVSIWARKHLKLDPSVVGLIAPPRQAGS